MFQKLKDTAGYQLFYYPTQKFKTTTIRIFFKGRLDERVEHEALLPYLLKRGSRNFPSLKHISRYLEKLYGSTLSMDIAKAGEAQIFATSMDVVNPRYIKDRPDLLIHGAEVLNDVLLQPLLEDGAFPADRFDQEKRNLERHVRGVIDDKITYTHLSLLKEMFRDEPYGNYEWGDIERISRLDRHDVHDAYLDLIRTAPVDVYVVGNLSDEEERLLPERLLPLEGRGEEAGAVPVKNNFEQNGEIIVEEQPLEQSKLEIGFRVDVSCSDADYYALTLYNAILGGGSYSKLFKKVREEASMAYYIYSSFEKLKGFLYVAAGIESDNLEAVTALVKECMEEMAGKRIAEEEFGNAKKAIITSLQAIVDNPAQIVEFDLLSRASGRLSEIPRIMEIIRDLTMDQVSHAARLIYPGKTFFLKGTGKNHGAV